MNRYFSNLLNEPGFPIASFLTFIGFLSGATGDYWLEHGLIGALMMSIFWIPVLLSAYNR